MAYQRDQWDQIASIFRALEGMSIDNSRAKSDAMVGYF